MEGRTSCRCHGPRGGDGLSGPAQRSDQQTSPGSPPGLALAVDIGGTKLAAGVVDARGGLIRRDHVPTPPDPDPEVVFAALVGVVHQVWDAAVDVCGVGCGGPMAAGGEDVSPLHIPAWRSFPLRRRLEEITGLRTFIDNDAKALALGEGWVGAAAGERNFLAMVVSTGVGGGIVLDGRLLDGVEGNAGHIGHLVVEPDGRECHCGGRGCLSGEASGTAIRQITGRPPSEAPAQVVTRAGTLVGRAIASTVHLLDLRLALIGGSVALGLGERFFQAARTELRARARLGYATQARLAPAGLGDRGPLIGAAAVGWRGLGRLPGRPARTGGAV